MHMNMQVWHVQTYLLLVNVCRYKDVYEYVRTGIARNYDIIIH